MCSFSLAVVSRRDGAPVTCQAGTDHKFLLNVSSNPRKDVQLINESRLANAPPLPS